MTSSHDLEAQPDAITGRTARHVRRAGPRRAIRLQRRYDADAVEVWDACTDRGRLGRWLGVLSGELAEGATVELCMSPPDADIATLEVLRLDAPRRLTVRWSWPGEPDSIVDVRVEAVDGGTSSLLLEHLPLPSDELTIEYGAGWEAFLARLGALLDGGEAGGVDAGELERHVSPDWRDAIESAPVDDRWPVVTPTGDASTIRLAAVLPATPDAVWAALTSAERLVAWFAEDVRGELSLDGSWTVTWDGGEASGTVVSCEPGRAFTTTWSWAHDAAGTDPSTVTVTLAPADRGTRLDLEHTGVTGPVTGYAAGWYAYGAGLAGHLDGRSRVEAEWQADWETALTMLRGDEHRNQTR